MHHIVGTPKLLGLAIAAGLLLALPAVSAAQTAGDGTLAAAGRDTARFAGWSAGAVELGAGMRSARGSRRVREVQRRLRAAGFSPGPVDGRFGPRTAGAVLAFQQTFGLMADGVVGSQTLHALRLGAARPTAVRRVKDVQRRLRRLGHDLGPINGRFGTRTRAAVARFQAAHDLPSDGALGPRTLLALRREQQERTTARTSTEAPEAARKDTSTAVERATSAEVASLKPTPSVGVAQNGEGVGIGFWPLLAIALLLVTLLLRAAFAAVRRSPDSSSPPATDPVASADPQRQRPASTAPNGVTGAGSATPGSRLRSSERPDAVGYMLAPAGDSGVRLELDTRRVRRGCEERNFNLVSARHDVEGAVGREERRPGLQQALDEIADGRASILVVTTLRSLGRSAADLGDVLVALSESAARLVVLGLEIDTATAEGRLAARIFAAEGQVGDDWIRHGSNAGRARERFGVARDGWRPIEDHPDLRARIAAMRAQGMTLRDIVDALNAEIVRTRRWGEPSSRSDVYSASGHRRRRFRSSASVRPGEDDPRAASEPPSATRDEGDAR